MRSSLALKPSPQIELRTATWDDLDGLVTLEQRVFALDRLSRQSLRRLLQSRTARVIVAECEDELAGAAVVLFRPRSRVARLYSIGVAPQMARRGVGAMLLGAIEALGAASNCHCVRLEAHETNAAAIACYRKSGYREFGRHASYYQDGGDAILFEKPLGRPSGSNSELR
jgi:ribosomal protein S18 acetylase RimI-like enzyme